jgi:hemerythrin superfamily protein
MFERNDDAIDLLKRDHREVEEKFAEFGRSTDDSERIQLAQQICSALSVHAKVEEELFYPAARDALGHDDAALVDEANVEHGSLKQLIAQIDGNAADEMFAARMQVLKEYVQHHVREEEMRLMPAVRRSVINLDSLGASIAQRKQALAEQAQSEMAALGGAANRVHIPGVEQAAAATTTRRRPSTAKRAARKTADRKAKSAPRARTRPAKRRAAGKRKSNPESQRRPVARRKV